MGVKPSRSRVPSEFGHWNFASTDGVLSGCSTGVASRVARGTDAERTQRLWIIKFGKPLAEFSVPAPS